jgi:DNA repair ATPase RecN
MAKKTKKSYKKPAALNDMTSGERMLVGNIPKSSTEERITKRREKVISLLSKFNEESNVIEKQVKQISTELKSTEREITKKMDELKVIQTELERRKEQLSAITEISNNYIDMVCEKFNVKKENIEKIRTEKR